MNTKREDGVILCGYKWKTISLPAIVKSCIRKSDIHSHADFSFECSFEERINMFLD